MYTYAYTEKSVSQDPVFSNRPIEEVSSSEDEEENWY